ncbi:MAG: porphobilinogen deaminase [Pseudomonadota bacterium]|jgi:hydroxymethylbilane synthase
MHIKVGTRGSKLALTQTGLVADALRARGHTVELIEIKTLGDKKQGTPDAAKGDKRDWIHELEVAVLNRSIDLAVHSGKDVPALLAPETELLPILRREDPRDVFIGRKLPTGDSRLRFEAIPNSGVVGTASLRRRAQLLTLRPDASVRDHRGNVPTRLQKLDDSTDLAGIILAAAGLQRLGINDIDAEPLDPAVFVPAINQGILTVQIHREALLLRSEIARLQESATVAEFHAERGCVELLDADCNSAVSIFAEAHHDTVTLHARVMLPDGSKRIAIDQTAPIVGAAALGRAVGESLIAQGANEILSESRRVIPRRTS